MRPGLRLSLSLLISILLFAAFAASAFLGLFDLFDARFYHPAVQRQAENSLKAAVAELDAYVAEKETLLGEALGRDSVRRSLLPEQSAADIAEREAIFARLLEDPDGIEGVRFIESTALRSRIHFSTWPGDVRSRDGSRIVYRDWGSLPDDEAYALIESPSGGAPRLILPGGSARIEISFPFTDAAGVYRGTALFALRLSSLADRLTRAGVLRLSDDLVPVPGSGFLAKVPDGARSSLVPLVARRWAGGASGDVLSLLAESAGGASYVLVSGASASGARYGFLMEGSAFKAPGEMKAILLASFFITSFLIVFLLFNLRQDPSSAVTERMKRLQIGILEEYIDKKADIDYRRWSRDLAARREDVRAQIKASAGVKAGKAAGRIDELIDKGWDEILDILGNRASRESEGVRLAEIESMMKRILATGTFAVSAGAVRAPGRMPELETSLPGAASAMEAEAAVAAVEELVEDLPEAEGAEELAEEIPEAEEVEELVEEIPEAEEVEELPEAEAAVAAVEELAEEIAEAETVAESEEEFAELEALTEDEPPARPLIVLSPLAEEEESFGIAPVKEEDIPEVEAPGADEVLNAWMKVNTDAEEEVEYLDDDVSAEESPRTASPEASETIEALPPAEDSPNPFRSGDPETASPGSGGRTRESHRFRIRGASITESVEAFSRIADEDLETLEEDWELSLAPLDLSALSGISLAALGEGQGGAGVLVDMALEESAAEAVAQEGAEPEELLEVVDDEIQMLSDEVREAAEELALAEDDRAGEAPTDVIVLRGSIEPYVPFFARGREFVVESERLGDGEARLEELPGGEGIGPARDEPSVIRESDGIYFIAEGVAAVGGPGSADPEFSSLVESVMASPRR